MKSIFFRYLLLANFLLLGTLSAFSQEFKTFKVRYQDNLKGDLTFIANNIVNRNEGKNERPNDAYNRTGDKSVHNDNLNMEYIDVDKDGSTFSSSSATLAYPLSNGCYRIRYAGLYWSATYPSEYANQTVGTDRKTDFNKVKFKVPGGNYVDITADEILYDGYTNSNMRSNSPYACYADVTSLLEPKVLADPQGEYTVANVRSVQGELANSRGGASAGWTLVVIYENPTLSGKLITTFDGFAWVKDKNSVTIDYTGFKTIPTGPVRANIGVAALEGDNKIVGDKLEIRSSGANFTTISNSQNPSNNFFNSNITLNAALTTNRNPNSDNTLGYDTDIFNLNNSDNSIIANNETQAKFKFSTDGDQYYPFFNSFNIEIIEPLINLKKTVENEQGKDITGQGVSLGQTLDYVLEFQNVGNDDATEFTIRDVLPVNVTLIENNLTLPTGVTHTYDPVSHTIVFTIDDNLVKKESLSSYEIRMRVRVKETCFDFVNACSNIIENLAYSTYRGVLNKNRISDDSVYAIDGCGFSEPGATNFLLDNLEDCKLTWDMKICEGFVKLEAGKGFVDYIWYKDVNGDGLIDGGDIVMNDGNPDTDLSTFLAADAGTYIVKKIDVDPCKGFNEVFIVEHSGTTKFNPIVDWFNSRNNDTNPTNDVQGEILTCSIDGSPLPRIFLCGANDTQTIQLNISGSQMEWEKLVEGSCEAAGDDCGNKNATCDWTNVGTGNSFEAKTAGKFRLKITQGGCFSWFYFNVFQNDLDFEPKSKDITCTAPGNITITKMPGGSYGYQLYNFTDNSIVVPYSDHNGPIFEISESGKYRVGIMQLDSNGDPIAGSCEFSTDEIWIMDREMEVAVVSTLGNCTTEGQGTIKIQASKASPNFSYELRKDDGTPPPSPLAFPLDPGGSFIDSELATSDNTHTFNVEPGDYFVITRNDEGCVDVKSVTVDKIPDPSLTALTTKDIGCSAGTIELEVTGGQGNPDFQYAIWSKNGTELYSSVLDIPSAARQVESIFNFGWRDMDGDGIDEYYPNEEGDYTFVVIDANGCSDESNVVTIKDNGVLEAKVEPVDVLCSGNGNGEIKIKPTGGVGPYSYSKDGGTSFVSLTPDVDGNVSFVGLAPGTYDIVVKDSSGCEVTDTVTIEQPFPLSASAGVSRDATCDPVNGAEVRVTNVVGGTPGYTYSFDGGKNYITSSTAQLHPGTYTVIVKDARGCTFPMPVTVAEIPDAPTVTLTPEVSYDCVGEGTITVGTESDADYDYTYMLNGVLNSPDTSNVFTKVASGTYTIRTIYKSKTPPTPSLLLSEDFGFGETIPSPNTTGYDFEDQTVDRPGNPKNINDGEYAVTSKIEAPFPTWANPIDHTTGTRDGKGRYLVINIGSPGEGKIIYSKTINDIIHNQPLQVSLWMLNLMREGTSGLDVDLTIEIREIGTGTVVGRRTTGEIPKNKGNSDWINPMVELNPGANSSLEFVIRTEISGDGGNDVAIDDIEVYQIPEVCERIVDMPVIVEPNKMFEAKITNATEVTCNGGDDGSIIFEVYNFDTTVGFEYSLDEVNWTTSTNSPVTIPNLSAGAHTINVRKVGDTTPECNLKLPPRTITEPTEVKVSAKISGAFTCDPGIIGATITAEASGGTPGYEYQLEYPAAAGGGIVPNYDFATNGNNRIFAGLPAGEYVVRAKDSNDCSEAISTVQTVVAPEVLTFDPTPIACYPGGNQGEIVVNVTAGNGGYSFFINKGNGLEGPFHPVPTTATTYTFTNLGPGDYTIEVRDQYSCSETSQIVNIAPELEVTASAPAITACASSTDVTITAIGGDGNYVYAVVPVGTTLADSDFSTINPVAISAAGDYEVHVRDNDGLPGFCSDVFPITIIKNDPITITPTVTHVDCFEGSNGAISLTATGGNALYEYSIDGGATYHTSGSFPNLNAGTYTVFVKDADKCTATVDVEVTQPAKITAEAIQTTDYTCLPGGEAAITVGSVTPTAGGSGDYQYSLNGGTWTTSTTGGTVFTGLTDGTYTIRVRDADADTCFITLPAVIIDPLPVAPTLSSEVAYNCDGSGNITITPFDADYTYILGSLEQTGALANVFTNVAPGNHTITVNYGSECTITIPVNVVAGKEFTATITNPVNISCFEGTDGSFVINASNFDPIIGFAYSVNGVEYPGPFTAPQTVSGLTAQNHNVVVWDLRDATCDVTLPQNLTQPAALTATASIKTPFTCDPNVTGATIIVDADGGTPTYEYSLDGINFQPTAIFTNVPAGTYTITVKDDNSCSVIETDAITVNAPEAPTFTVEPTACYTGNNDGTIKVDVTSIPGNGNFQFRINKGVNIGVWETPDPTNATTYIFTGLINGSYTIDVKDGFGCSAQLPVELNPELRATAVLEDDLTCLIDAEITINAVGGFGTYTFEWSNSQTGPWNTTGFTGNSFSTNAEGTYYFRVTDSTTPEVCTVISNPVVVSPAVNPEITSITPTDLNCNGDNSGSLAIIIDTNLGLAPYTINVVNTTINQDFGTQTSGLPAGTYTVRVTDAKGCTVTEDVDIDEPAVINYTVSSEPITCDISGGVTNPGSITITGITGGTAEYTYKLTANNGILPQTHTTTSTDRDHTFNILTFGIYDVDIVDANGCSAFTTQIIASPPDDLDIDVSTSTANCTDGGTAIVEVAATFGSGNYEFGILESFIAPYTSTYYAPDVVGGSIITFSQTANGVYLTPGITYTFVVYDLVTKCYYFETAETPIDSPSNMTANLDAVANVSCTGSADGNISFTFDNYDAAATAVNYEIFYKQSNDPISPTPVTGSYPVSGPVAPVTVENFATLPPGEYYILLSEEGGPFDGCSIFGGEFTIRESVNLLKLDVAVSKNDNCNTDAGVITANGQFGTGPYEYQILPSSTTAPTLSTWAGSSTNVFNVEGGDYDVYVKDAYNCIQTKPINMPTDPTPEISVLIVDECVKEGTYQVSVTLDTPGSAPYSISLNGAPFQNITFDGSNRYTISGLSSGISQTVEIKDLNGCGETETFTIYPKFQADVSVSKLLDCTISPNAELTISGLNGSGSYAYEIDGPGANDEARTNLPAPANSIVWNKAEVAGIYVISIYDNNTPTCDPIKIPIEVKPEVRPKIETIKSTDITCFDAKNGKIEVVVTDRGTGPYTFEITSLDGVPVSIAPTSITNTWAEFTGLEPTTTAAGYIVTVKGDAVTNNCETVSSSILIAEPDPIAITALEVVQFACTVDTNTDNNASITVTTVTGGSGKYFYEFVNNQGTLDTADDVVVKAKSEIAKYTETNRLGGSYTINVYDDNKCVGSTTTSILPYMEMTDIALTPANPSCIPGADGTIGIVLGLNGPLGTTNIRYDIDGLNVVYHATHTGNGAVHTFTGLGIGKYQITATNLDTGCVVRNNAELKDPNTFEVDVVSVTDVICYDTATGTATFKVSDATYLGAYTWEVYNDNGTPSDYSDDIPVDNANSGIRLTTIGLAVGNYYVSFAQVGLPACDNKKEFSIAGPDAAITADTKVTPITCEPTDNGIIEIIATGGWGGYTYYVGESAPATGDFVTDPKFVGLEEGTYQAWVRDAKGCETMVEADIILDLPTQIIADLRINDHNCSNFEGEIEVVGIPDTDPIRGGQGSNYSYQLQHWDGNSFVNTRPLQTTTIFSGLGAGQYQVIVSDQWGCTTTTTTPINLYDVMMPSAKIDKLIDCTPDYGGQITIMPNGGSGPFTYTGKFPDNSDIPSTSLTLNADGYGIFTKLTEVGKYTFRITDDTGCFKDINYTWKDPIQPPTPIINDFENVTCFGLANGTITVSVPDNGLDPYTFQITHKDGVLLTTATPPTSSTNTSAVFTGLDVTTGAGYTITVTAVNGCSETITKPITQPDELEILKDPAVTEFNCNIGENKTNYATIMVTDVVGGTGKYRYVFVNDVNPGIAVQDGPYALYTETNPAGGTYTITVYDEEGCKATTTATIIPFVGISEPKVSLANAGISCIGDEDIKVGITLTPAMAAINLEYTVVGNNGYSEIRTSTNSEETFTNLGVGNYIITITNTNTDCSVKTTHEVKEPKVIKAIATKLTNETCLNDIIDGGSFSVEIKNYKGTYTYQVYDSNNVALTGLGHSGNGHTDSGLLEIPGLTGGTYYVVITGTEHPFCSVQSTRVTIDAPETPISADITEASNVSCDNDRGSILVKASGGQGPYTIKIASATQTFTQTGVYAYLFGGLSAGVFTVTITDALDCEHTDTIELEKPDPIVATISPDIMLECYGDTDGVVFATIVSGGFGTPKYQLNVYDPTGADILRTSAPQWGSPTSNTFGNLPAGIYSITITDDGNCGRTTDTMEIKDPSDVKGELALTQILTCEKDAELLLTASGGTGPYKYSEDGINYFPMTGGGGNIHRFTVGAGTYKYFVQDEYGCGNVLSSTITETAIVPLSITLDTSAAVINCNGESTAMLIAKADGGLGNYMYELFTDVNLTNSVAGPQPSGTFSNLGMADYYVRVTSEDCVVVSEVTKITEPDPLVVTESFTDESCFGAKDGTITVELSGGSGGYQFAISPRLNRFDTVNTFTNLAPGTYTVIAQDKNGCFEQLEYTIAPAVILEATVITTPEICFGSKDGTIELTITGGTGPYSTSINSMDDADFIEGRTSFSGLAAGTYAIFIRDANGCETNVAAVIDAGVNLNATVTPVYECTGDTPNNSIVLVLEDGTVAADVLYALDSADPNDMVLEPNFTNLAPGNHYITIAHANGCERTVNFTIADFEPLVLKLDQRSLNQITATATGGQAKYTYYFGDVNNGEKNTYYINKTGTYTVRVVDENGCESVADIFMEFVDIDIPNFFTPNGDGGNDKWKPKNQEGFPKILTIIFDRYGREVYRMGLNDGGWDGIYKGSELPTGDYWYVIKLKGENDDREFVGHFTLYR